MSPIFKLLEDNINVDTGSDDAANFCDNLINLCNDNYEVINLYNWIMSSDLSDCSSQFLVIIMMQMNHSSRDLHIDIICYVEDNEFKEMRDIVARKLLPIAQSMKLEVSVLGLFRETL